MKKLLVFLLLAVFGYAYWYYRLPNVIERVRSSVVRVQVQRKFGRRISGSGVVLDDGLILTARHVIADANMVSIIFDDGSKIKSFKFFISRDIGNVDLGLIIIEDVDDHAHLVDFDVGMYIGNSVFMVGSPLGMQNSVAVGHFSAYNKILQGERLHQLDINGAPGNSGCPVFNYYGNVVGILVRGNNYGMAFMVPLETCKAVINIYENVQRSKIN